MDINIRYIPKDVNNWEVTRAISPVLHSELETAPVDSEGRRPLNFRVTLNANPAGGVGNNGTGILTLPTLEISRKFLSFVRNNPIRIKSKKVLFSEKKGEPRARLVETLKKTPYISPDIEEEHQRRLEALNSKFRLDTVQFGIFHQSSYPRSSKESASRAFSVEWEREYISNSAAWLEFKYDSKLIRVTIGNGVTESYGFNIAINLSSIRKIGVGCEGKPYICFDTLTPPVMEAIQLHPTTTGDSRADNRKSRCRVGSIHPGHAVVAPYCPHLRLVLFSDGESNAIDRFKKMCQTAGLPAKIIVECGINGPTRIEASRQNFFTDKRMEILHKTLAKFDWPVAFQLESLLHNGLLHTGDLDNLLPEIRALTNQRLNRSSAFVGELLRRYNEALQGRPPQESPMQCFKSVQDKFEFSPPSKAFRCYHVTFTPTRMILEGPYASQSNRVLRQYQGYEDHFIRVDFRDEDRLQYHWDREVDSVPLLVERVGKTLKEGFSLAGRSFEFLAYSSSALRDHAVWFMNPFHHSSRNIHVNAAAIRDSLGNFEDTVLLRCPSKYAARLAQAFTATDPSVDVLRSQWKEVPDLGQEPYLFTDGVGTISPAFGDRIWAKLCETKPNPGRLIQPSAYQIRFLGYKGVVCVNPFLDEREDGIQMQLRPSMRKFEAKEADSRSAPLEIAQAFERPNQCYLNRPLVMLLEDVGVRRDVFQELQDLAVENAKTIDDSISHFCNALRGHHLGSSYQLREILGRLRDKYGMDLASDGRTVAIDNPFLRQIRQVAMVDILRDIKHSARIPVPDSFLLVGVADEGPAYVGEPGFENVYCLGVAEIYACIQRPGDDEPIWLEGNVSISRSPVAHLGDVQRVRAIGKPPADRPCLFAHLKNVVVMPSVGPRSLASCLGGGDVDGDMFSVICYDSLLPNVIESPASYTPLPTKDLQRDSTVEDICDFIVEYIHSDLLGLLSIRLLVIADQSSEGMRDRNCVILAELCSHAVDYPKQGTPPQIESDQLPETLIRCKPDWHASDDYYVSTRALGYLFRSVQLDEQPIFPVDVPPVNPYSDPISIALLSSVEPYIGSAAFVEHPPAHIMKIFRRYADELRYICATHTLISTPDSRLLEAEVVVGTILAKCAQPRWRKERMFRMRTHAGALVADIQHSLTENGGTGMDQLIQALEFSWFAWDLSLRRRNEFGAQSFGLIALGAIFNCLDKLDTRSPTVRADSEGANLERRAAL